jgi:sugar phosphate permease
MGYGSIGIGQLAADWFPRRRGAFMGLATIGMTVASGFIPLIFSVLVPKYGITNTMLMHAALMVVIAVLILIFIKNNPEEVGAHPDNDKTVSREELMKEFKEMDEYRKNSPPHRECAAAELHCVEDRIGLGPGHVRIRRTCLAGRQYYHLV